MAKLLLLELKTTSEDIEPGSIYWKKLTLDNQISMYLSAARDMGHDVSGVLYDVIRKTALRPVAKGTETPESYEARILAQIAESPERYYQRGVIVRTADEIREHDQDIWQTAELIQTSREQNRWPRYVGSCVSYGSSCDYWPVCSGETTIESDRYLTRDSKTHLPMLSPSAVRTWRECPRKYYYAQELRRRPVGDGRKPLWFGRLMHAAIEAYNLGDFDKAVAACSASPEPHEAAHARALLRGYAAMYGQRRYTFVATEKPFERALVHPDTGDTSPHFVLGGIVDAVVEDTQ